MKALQDFKRNLYSTETPEPRKNLHADSGISDKDFHEYDTKMFRSKQLGRLARGSALGAVGAYMMSQPAGLAARGAAYLMGVPIDAKNLNRIRTVGKGLKYTALGSAALSLAHKYDAMGKDPVYKGQDALYKATGSVINPKTNLERYYADYSRDVEPMAKQINMSKSAAVTDFDNLAVSGTAVAVPYTARRKLWRAIGNASGEYKKFIPYVRAALKVWG